MDKANNIQAGENLVTNSII